MTVQEMKKVYKELYWKKHNPLCCVLLWLYLEQWRESGVKLSDICPFYGRIYVLCGKKVP